MKNLIIRNKLLVGFVPLALILVGFAGFTVMQLSTLFGAADELAHKRLPINMRVATIDTATSDYLVAQRDEILDVEQAKIVADQNRQRQLNASIAKTLDEIRALAKRPHSKELLARFRAGWDRYVTAGETVSKLAERNANVEALGLLRDGQKLFQEADAILKELAAYQQQVANESSDDAERIFTESKYLSLLAVLLGMAVMAGVLVVLVRSVASPISAMTKAMGRLADGDLAVEVGDDGRRDEVGTLATALRRFRDQLNAAERSKAEQTALICDSIGTGLSRLAEGDLVSRVDADLVGPFAKLKADFNAAATALQATLTQVSEATSGINNGASDIRQASDDLSLRTEQQAASLEETAAAMDEITATVRQTAANATKANEAVRHAREQADHSGEIVGTAVQAMGEIERTSNEISEIISVIDGIAFQTNLLALNAGVEAARAGDAGKGFAVVASEVRALAQRTAEAAKDVKSRITASSEQVKVGVQLVGDAGSSLNRIVERIAEVDGLMASIASATETQATGLHQINTAVSEMDSVTQQNAAMVEQSTAAARSLAGEADELARRIARFKTGDGLAAPAAPGRPLQVEAVSAGRKIAHVARRSGNAAVALANDAWSEF